MRLSQIKPNNVIYLLMLNRFRKLKMTDQIEQLMSEIRTRFQKEENYRPSAELFAVAIRHFTSMRDFDKVVQVCYLVTAE